jgi:hypothetical protein
VNGQRVIEQERTALERAEHTANELARIVAIETQRTATERRLREEAEARVQEMARLVAYEFSRAEEAEERLRALGY